MPFIGNTPQTQSFAPAVDYFSGNGVTVTFTLSRPVVSVAQLTVAVDNVIQNPSSAFTVSGNSITFTSAPLSGTNNIWVEYTSLITTYAAISQDPSVIGDITATGGFLAEGDFGNSYIDGTIVDYVTGNARITTGPIDDMTFYHGGTSGRSEMMRLSYAGNSYIVGNLGVGTITNPDGLLTLPAAASSTPKIRLQSATSDVDVTITSYADASGTYAAFGANGYLNSSGDEAVFDSAKRSAYVRVDGRSQGAVIFGTATSGVPSERMRITSGGDLLVGTTSSYGKQTIDIGSNVFTTDENQAGLTVQGTVANTRPLIMVRSTSSGQDTAFRVSANRSGTQDRWTIGCNIARNSDNLSINYGTSNTGVGTERFYFTSGGAAYNTTGTWGTISDARFKENIVDATPKLDKINQLKVRNFNLIDEELKQIGLIAQEVEQVFPSLVETSELKDGKEQKTVKMSVFVPILIKAIQELKAEVDSLKAQLEAK